MNTFNKIDGFAVATISRLLGQRPVIMCIGSDRVTGDSLGPIVGEMLVRANVNAFVYGTLTRPVTALNLKNTIDLVNERHPNTKILAIDSSVGRSIDIGHIRVMLGPLKPGSADGKKLPKVGDISITATVTDTKITPLTAVRLGLIFSLAETICDSVVKSFPSQVYSTLKI